MEKKKDHLGSDEKTIGTVNGIQNINPDISEEIPEDPSAEKPSIEKPPAEEKKFTEKDFELCKFFATVFPFFIIAEYKNNDVYNLTEKEKETLAPLWAELFNKHLPTIIMDYKEEMGLATAIFTMLVLKSNVSGLVKDVKTEKNIQDIPMENVPPEKDVTDFENE